MENFRNNLAKEIRKAPKEERADILAKAKESPEYQQALTEKIKEGQTEAGKVEKIKTNRVEGNEGAPAPKEDTYIKTEKGAMRGELIAKNGTERIIRCDWSHDGVGVGLFIKIDTRNLKAGEPLRSSFSSDGGKTYGAEHVGGKLAWISRWERGAPVTAEDLIAKTQNRMASASLPDNVEVAKSSQGIDAAHAVEKTYTDTLPEYDYVPDGIRLANENREEAKCNFLLGSPNLGWKVHLNIAPANVASASDYLKQNGYAHKYLTGGSGGEGKAFTVYFGAKGTMDKWSQQLAKDLGNVLCKPVAPEETEVAAGIVARFTSLGSDGREMGSPEDTFLQYGEYGLSARRAFVLGKGGWKNIATPEQKAELARDAFQNLTRLYGSYFHG